MGGELNSVFGRNQSSSPPTDHVQEMGWLRDSRRGDTLAFNRLVLKWERTVYNVAYRMLQDRDDAAEASQEIFFAAYRNIRRFRMDSKFSTWLYRIAVNHCISRARKRPPGTHVALTEMERDAVAPPEALRAASTQDGELLRQEDQNRVRQALLCLSPDQRVVIELKFYQELTFEEIADILRIPTSTIKSRLYTGLELLKSRLGGKA